MASSERRVEDSDVHKLAEQLSDIAAFWELFVGQLGVPHGVQEEISLKRDKHARFAQICLVDGLHHWVTSDPSPTIEKVLAVLSSDTIRNKKLAERIGTQWKITENSVELKHGNREMKFSDLTLVNKIGAGSFGKVFAGYWNQWDGDVAIKRVPMNNAKEVSILSQLDHPNIITLYGTAFDDPCSYTVMELAINGSLFDHILKNRRKPDFGLSLHWAIDIAEGMNYLHKKQLVHRNLRSSNVLFTSTLTAKIGGFGCSRELDHTTRATQAGSIEWMAPEVIMEEPYSMRCDLFSYGMVLWELVTHDVPFEELGGSLFMIMKSIIDGQMPVIPDAVEGHFSDLIQQCWDRDPKKRPSFGEIVETLKAKQQAKDVPRVPEHQNRNIEYSDITFDREPIGHGKFGTVYTGHWDKWDVAIKEIAFEESIAQEVRIMSELKHPNVITLYGTASRHPHLYIVLELAECSLFSHLEKNKNSPKMESSLRWAAEVAEGMRFLHEREIVHRDLKSLNVLLSTVANLKVAKICDFGTARRLDHRTKATQTGTVEWMAPEVIEKGVYSRRCDQFSYGTVLWELVTHKVPFENMVPFDVLKSIVYGKMLPIPTTIEDYVSSLIQNCWRVDPEERPTFVEIMTALEKKETIKERAISKIDWAALKIQSKPIGEGGFGTVLRGHWSVEDRAVAIKKILYNEAIVKEVNIMSELKHPNIVKLYGTASKPPHLYIVMELADCSLYSHIQKHKGKPDMEKSVRWAADIAEGMRYIHEKEIVHRDLKSLNVLLRTIGSIEAAKICDFDTARLLAHEAKATTVGTVQWMAPEVINEDAYSKRCDLFSYGTVLWELVTHEVPFEELKGHFSIMKAISEAQMPAIPDVVEGYISELIQQCWNQDPQKRPSFVDILSLLRKDQPGQVEACDSEVEIKIGSKPLLQHLELLPCAPAAIKVAEEIKDNWWKVAEHLEMPEGDRKEIEHQTANPQQQALAMLGRWLEGGYECEEPVTWDTLIDALSRSGHRALARKLTRKTVD